MSQNKNNSNTGGASIGHDRSAIAGIVPDKVVAEVPIELWKSNDKLPGPDFEPGEPAGREAKPSPHAEGFSYGG